jgi:hypothetical protein
MSGRGGPIVLCFGVVDEADIIRDFPEFHLSLSTRRTQQVKGASLIG